jgi:hypothetical protein
MAIPMDRTKRAVEPFRLALMTQRHGEVNYHPYSSLHGLGQDLVPPPIPTTGSSTTDDILRLGGNWLDDYLKQKLGTSTSTDPIAIQNAVGAAMDQISAQYYPLRDANLLSVATITLYQQAFQTLINSFCAKMRTIGTARALAGCTTIQYWGGKWIADRELEKASATGAGGVGTTPPIVIDPSTGQPIVYANTPLLTGGLSTISGYLPLLLGGLLIYMMMKKKI